MINSSRAHATEVVVAKPRQVAEVLLSEAFMPGDVRPLRLRCYECALGVGLSRERALMFTFSINEAMANAVQHGGGGGAIVLLHDGACRLIAEVMDAGPGIAAAVPVRMPPPHAPRGRGLWMATRLVDQLTVQATERGTMLRLIVATEPQAYPWSGSRHDARMASLLAQILLPG